jgi:Ca2+-binding EF-hand superfamily protein
MNNLTKHTSIILSSCAVAGLMSFALVPIASADHHDGHMNMEKKNEWLDKKFSELDADSDGKVSAEEYQKIKMQRFSMHDKDTDGSLSKEEFKEMLMDKKMNKNENRKMKHK